MEGWERRKNRPHDEGDVRDVGKGFFGKQKEEFIEGSGQFCQTLLESY